MKTNTHFRSYLAQFFLELKIFQAIVVEKIETNIFYVQKTPSPPENLAAAHKIVWKRSVEQGRPQMTLWRMRTAGWIPKATNTHSEYAIFIAFPLQQWLHERATLLRYTYIVCIVVNKLK
jgi:hypothetical protein